MTETTSTTDCTCASTRNPRKSGIAKYLAGFATLCAICCALPAALVALGVIGIASGAYLGAGLQVAVIAVVVLAAGYLLLRYVGKN